jgi:hypothetical protein
LKVAEGTTYQRAQMERFPGEASFYRQIERKINKLTNDVAWLERLKNPELKADY